MDYLLLQGTTRGQVQPRGILRLLPQLCIPYGELMRLDKPAGYFAFYFPHLVGLLFAKSALQSPLPSSLAREVAVHVCLLVGTLFLRGASCTWNDTLDAPYDRQVERCRSRPIARGAVSRLGGVLFTIEQTVLGLLLTLAPLPRACWAPAILLAATQVVYPLFKRFTDYPQVWLGFSFGCGIGVGAGAGGMDLATMFTELVSGNNSSSLVAEHCQIIGAALCLYAAGAANTIIYDTIYGHQDLADDIKAGVRSLAVAWQGSTKRNCIALAIIEVALLAAVGCLTSYGLWYNTIVVGGTALVLSTMLYLVELTNPASCMWCFNWLIWGTGAVLVTGLLAESKTQWAEV